ncbi:hypothetical protein BDV96DRAFT_239313 [Lophiotrema nucula]|uniref:Uncharacterized protein n=1 Tax=Lophiotrema nucula TaxID=690887 RepID=A0A6A5YRE7_9PLEO|nr:hypothetical protein BDV96DRAFT_239313 [Lophiotrema nucula]
MILSPVQTYFRCFYVNHCASTTTTLRRCFKPMQVHHEHQHKSSRSPDCRSTRKSPLLACISPGMEV